MTYISIFQFTSFATADCCSSAVTFFPNVKCIKSDGMCPELMPRETGSFASYIVLKRMPFVLWN